VTYYCSGPGRQSVVAKFTTIDTQNVSRTTDIQLDINCAPDWDLAIEWIYCQPGDFTTDFNGQTLRYYYRYASFMSGGVQIGLPGSDGYFPEGKGCDSWNLDVVRTIFLAYYPGVRKVGGAMVVDTPGGLRSVLELYKWR